ncbi:MAG: hypothetical protein MUE56_08655 [Ignavibacteria bacterium]|nr:hypothetical protein [Ignavibacteria bacterium]
MSTIFLFTGIGCIYHPGGGLSPRNVVARNRKQSSSNIILFIISLLYFKD